MYHLRLLHEAHFIFTIHIVEPDDRLGVPGIFGYVVARADVLEALVTEYHRRLEHVYEVEHGQKKAAATIIRELMPEIRTFNSTPLGQILNIRSCISSGPGRCRQTTRPTSRPSRHTSNRNCHPTAPSARRSGSRHAKPNSVAATATAISLIGRAPSWPARWKFPTRLPARPWMPRRAVKSAPPCCAPGARRSFCHRRRINAHDKQDRRS